MIPPDMSPEFFRILAALVKLVILAMLLERALVLVFDYRWFRGKISNFGFKSPIAFLVSWAVCASYDFDVLGVLFDESKTTPMGIFITAAIVAGGSAGAITLFQGVMKFSKSHQDDIKKVHEAQKAAEIAEANARRVRAEADAKVAEKTIHTN